jgi:hypothetical protein
MTRAAGGELDPTAAEVWASYLAGGTGRLLTGPTAGFVTRRRLGVDPSSRFAHRRELVTLWMRTSSAKCPETKPSSSPPTPNHRRPTPTRTRHQRLHPTPDMAPPSEQHQ